MGYLKNKRYFEWWFKKQRKNTRLIGGVTDGRTETWHLKCQSMRGGGANHQQPQPFVPEE